MSSRATDLYTGLHASFSMALVKKVPKILGSKNYVFNNSHINSINCCFVTC